MQHFTQPAHRRTCLLALCLLLAVTLAACTPVVGSGHIVSEARPVTGFSEIELTGSGEVTITQTGVESVKVSADDNVLPLLTTEVRGKRLSLGLKPNLMLSHATVRYEVIVADLTAVDLTGSGDITLAKLAGDRLDVHTSGSGKIVANGRVQALAIDLSGSGEFDGEALTSQQVKVAVSGSGDVVVNASETLAADITGSGNIEYTGNPQVTTDVSGSGSVSPK